MEANSQVIRQVQLWEHLPELSETVITDDIKAKSADNIFHGSVPLPHQLVITNFTAPTQVTKYSLNISRNIVYRLEGICYCLIIDM